MNFTFYQEHINQRLENFLPSELAAPSRLHQAMRYAVLNGGKRIRPLLVYATGKIFDVATEFLDYPAAAIEFIHCYSLIHDDLPAMDNDDLRRGKPTCHKAFDEATAILAGDALQVLAFKVLSEIDHSKVSTKNIVIMMQLLAEACGSNAICGGQMLDLQSVGKKINFQELETMHQMKTGALVNASVQLAALLGNANPDELKQLHQFAMCLGLAFQIQDDILDVESTTEQLGKRQGADIALNKPTYVSILGLEAAKLQMQETYQKSLDYIVPFGKRADYLESLIISMKQRNY